MVTMPKRTSTTDRVHALLHEEIIEGKLAGGSLHSIYEMSEGLGVSRTPVGDAVLRLADGSIGRVRRRSG